TRLAKVRPHILRFEAFPSSLGRRLPYPAQANFSFLIFNFRACCIVSDIPMLSVDSSIQADPYRVHMRVLAAVVLLVFVLLGKTCIQHGAFKAASETSKVQGCDFTAYYSAGELARTGKNIYDYRSSSTPFRPYIYPPMFAVFPMAPLSLL